MINSGIPEPYMFGLEAVGVKAGLGTYTRYDNAPLSNAELAILETRCYWNRDEGLEFLFVGCELAHGCFSRGVRETYFPDGYGYLEPVFSYTWEIVTPQVGFALLGRPYEPLRSKCCLWSMGDREYFSPRIELSTGTSILNFNAYSYYEKPITFLTWRNELRLYPLRFLSMKIEHRFKPGFNQDTVALKNSLSIMLSLNLGIDILMEPSDRLDEKEKDSIIVPPPSPKPKRKYKAYLYESNIVQASGGVDVYSGEFLFPALSISLMDLRVYPERIIPLFVGIECARGYIGNTLDSTPSIKMLSLVFPRVGLVILMKPRTSMRSKWIGLFEGERFVPRLEFSAGTSLINLENLGGSNWEPFSDALGTFAITQTEIRWKFSATVSMHAEHRWFMPSRFSANFAHSFGLSLSVALGKDNIRTNKKD